MTRNSFPSFWPASAFGPSSDPVGRLEPMPDAARVDCSAAHTNRYAHLSPGCFPYQPHCNRPVHAATTSPLANVVGPATGAQCLLLARAFGRDSLLRDSNRLCDLPGPDESVEADGRKLGAQVTEWSGRALCTLRQDVLLPSPRSSSLSTCSACASGSYSS